MVDKSIKTWTEETTSLCPKCLTTVPATICESAGKIWMTKRCERHGEARTLIASDAKEYLRLREYVSPRNGTACCGVGETCGEGPPVCVLLLEVTLACNLRCPTCYADAHGHDYMPIEEVRSRLDAFFKKQQGSLDVLMLSGGEPTIHPRFAEILDLAVSYPVGRVLINTNGLRMHQSDETMAALAKHRDRIEIFFSFSSFRPEVHERLYGRDLRIEKQSALERAQKARLYTILVPTIERGVNDDEIGDLYRFALSMDNINGLNFQPVMSAGRYEHDFAGKDRMTLTDVILELEKQTHGALNRLDFVALPCSHPDCCALTYGFLDEKRETITPLPRHLEVAKYLDIFSDRISFAGLLGSAARRVWSDMASMKAGETLKDLATLFKAAGIREIVPLIGKRDVIGKRIFRIVVKPFMDAHSYDHKRTEQCCTKILTEDGESISFCEYNVLHRTRRKFTSQIALSLKG